VQSYCLAFCVVEEGFFGFVGVKSVGSWFTLFWVCLIAKIVCSNVVRKMVVAGLPAVV
jgi:hypothetical protein